MNKSFSASCNILLKGRTIVLHNVTNRVVKNIRKECEELYSTLKDATNSFQINVFIIAQKFRFINFFFDQKLIRRANLSHRPHKILYENVKEKSINVFEDRKFTFVMMKTQNPLIYTSEFTIVLVGPPSV